MNIFNESDRRATYILGMVFLLVCVGTWNTYGNLLIDNFHDIWFAQRLLDGDVLYKDFHYQYGILPPYLLAAMFALFGTNFTSLVCFGLLIALGAAVLIYRICRLFTGSIGAFVAVLIFLMHSVFARSEPEGIFNFIRPYSLASTLFGFCALGILFFLMRFTLEGEKRDYHFLHIFIVLAFLSRPVMFLPLWLVVLGFLLFASGRRTQLSFFSLNSSWMIAALMYLSYLLPTQSSAAFLNNTFFFAFLSKGNAYSSGLMGFDVWPIHVQQTFFIFVMHFCVLLLIVAVVKLVEYRSLLHQRIGFLSLSLVLLGLLWSLWQWLDPISGKWLYQYRVMLISNIAGTLFFGVRTFKGQAIRDRAYFGLAVIALVSSLRMLLNPIPYVYGFFVLLPAFILYTLCVFELMPGIVFSKEAFPAKKMYRLAVFLCFSGLSFGQMQLYWHFQQSRTYRLETNLGQIILPQEKKSEIFSAAIEYIQAQTPQDATLVAFPEGVSLNVLGHRASPWGFPHFFSVDMELFGEDTFLDQLKSAPPTHIAIVHRPTSEYGPTTFGQDYARELAGWLRVHYQPIQVFGAMPFQSDAFGIMLAERRRPEADSP